jgi:hypothetical protein
VRCYIATTAYLVKQEEIDALRVALQQIVVGKTKVEGGKQRHRLIGPITSDRNDSHRFCWIDGTPIFATSTKHLRILRTSMGVPKVEQKNLANWQKTLSTAIPRHLALHLDPLQQREDKPLSVAGSLPYPLHQALYSHQRNG